MTGRAAGGARQRRTRADAIRNRGHILRATVDLLVEQGPTVPLETIAKRANVGIATLYRHFPDRMELLREVTLDLLRRSTRGAQAALAEEEDAFTALARFMHDSIDLRIGAVLPVLAERVPVDEELIAARLRSRESIDALVRAAHEQGSLRPDLHPGDVDLLIIRFAMSLLPGSLTPEDNHRLSHRHLELLLDGLLRVLAASTLPDPPRTADALTTVPRNDHSRRSK